MAFRIETVTRWFVLSVVAAILWGLWALLAKVVADRLSVQAAQAYFSVGLLPLLSIALRRHTHFQYPFRPAGLLWGLATGVLAGLGNLALYGAFSAGGATSMVTPSAALSPAVTILVAIATLGERLTSLQWVGLAFSLAAMYLFAS